MGREGPIGRRRKEKMYSTTHTYTHNIQVEDLEAEVVRHQIRRNGVHLVTGTARFVESGQTPGDKIKLAVLLTDPEQERKGIYKHRDASLPKTLLTG
jgi:hypothetical protein